MFADQTLHGLVSLSVAIVRQTMILTNQGIGRQGVHFKLLGQNLQTGGRHFEH
jgi:hypothetical protein